MVKFYKDLCCDFKVLEEKGAEYKIQINHSIFEKKGFFVQI